MKTIWDIAKLLTDKKKTTKDIHQINVNGTISSDSQIIFNYFNSHFLSIIENLIPIAKNNINNPIDYLYQAFKQPFPNIKYQNISTAKIGKIIESLKAKDSHGYDEISVEILKLSSPFISLPLNYICKKLLSSGIFSCRLKYAEVVPLFKKGDKKDMSNYRPICFIDCIF